MSRWQSLSILCVALSLAGCGHQKGIGYGMAVVGGLGVVGGGLGGLGCASTSSQCKSGDVAFLVSLALGGATVGGIGLAIASATSTPAPEPEPRAVQGKGVDPNAPDPNDAPRHEEDVHFGSEKAAPGE
jgi:hypothetical protein